MFKVLNQLEPGKFYSLDDSLPNFQYFGLLTNKRFAVKLQNDDIITDTLYEGYGEFSKNGRLLSNIKEFKLYDTNKF